MATLRGLVNRFGVRPTARFLQDTGVTQPSGARINERWLRESLKPRSDRKDAAKAARTAKANVSYIDAKVKGVDYRRVKPPSEAVAPSGAAPQVQIKTGSPIGRGPLGGDKWVGTLDTRAQLATRDLTKEALRKLLTGSGLSPSSDWKLIAFGEYYGATRQGSDPWTAGEGFWHRKYRRVAIKKGFLFLTNTQGDVVSGDWADTELEIAHEIAHETQVATDQLRFTSGNPLATLDAHKTESIKRKLQRGDPKDPEHYPSFAARYCTIASGRLVWWRNVYAASLNYPVGGQ